MRVSVLLAIALSVAFATPTLAGLRQAHGTATGALNPRPTGGIGSTGALPGAPHTNPFGGEPGSPTFDPLAQTLSSSSIALLEVELQRLIRTQ